MEHLKEIKELLGKMMELDPAERMIIADDIAIVLSGCKENYIAYLLSSLDRVFLSIEDDKKGLEAIEETCKALKKSYLERDKEEEKPDAS